MPSVFLSHGAPSLALDTGPAGDFLDRLATLLPAPRAIVVCSAHLVRTGVVVGGAAAPRTVHDFRGFAPELHTLDYPARGDPALAADVQRRLANAGIACRLEPELGLDHGVWVPLFRAWPRADVAVVPVSVEPTRDAAHHWRIGRALAGLRDADVLVLGSGGFVHNLGELSWEERDAPPAPWAAEFREWMIDALQRADLDAVLDWERRAPHARRAHPSTEHLLPLFFALGVAGDAPRSRLLHQSLEFGSLALDALAFE